MNDSCPHSTPTCRPCLMQRIADLEFGLRAALMLLQSPGDNLGDHSLVPSLERILNDEP